MDPRTLTDSELASLLKIFRTFSFAGHSRFFMNLYWLVEKESLARVRFIEITDFSDHEIAHAIVSIQELLDTLKDKVLDDSPLSQFLQLALSSALQ